MKIVNNRDTGIQQRQQLGNDIVTGAIKRGGGFLAAQNLSLAMKSQNMDRALIVTVIDPHQGTAAVVGQNTQSIKIDPLKVNKQKKSVVVVTSKRGSSVGPPQKLENIPTFDVSDLEKKSPAELDVLLRQMDDYAIKAKAEMENV